MDVVLSIDYFEDILKNAKIKTGREVGKEISVSELSFEEQRQWLIDHKIIGGPQYDENDKPIVGTGAKANIIGYRIPTQAISSIHAMRCVDVLPVVRDTIIMPAAITSITGSDFDIDKFFLSRKYIDNNGNM